MLEHPTSLAVFTSRSQKGRLKTTGGTLPLTSSILWQRITNRSLLSTTYPEPKLTLTYCVETVGERAEGFLTCSWYFLHCWENGTFCSIVMQPVGKIEISHFLYYKERKPALLCGLWLVSNAPTACEICARVIHHSRASEVEGNSSLTPAETQSGGSIVPVASRHPQALTRLHILALCAWHWCRILPLWQLFDKLQSHNTENIQAQMCCFFLMRH